MFMFLDGTAAATTTQQGGLMSILSLIIPFALIAIVFYFFLIRPQKKQEKEAAQMRDSLQVGDEVTTIGGIIGRVVSIKDETFTLETSRDRTKMRFLRSAIKSVDVRVNDIRAAASEKTEEDKKENTKEQKKTDKKANKAEKEAAQNDENSVTTDSPAEDKKD